jgi:glycosyltransferase involved in cell wall biosynthesis
VNLRLANCDLVQPGINGLLAGSPGEWRRSLKQLVSDVALRRQIGKQARAHVLEHYSAATAVEQMAAVFHEAAGSARSSTAA